MNKKATKNLSPIKKQREDNYPVFKKVASELDVQSYALVDIRKEKKYNFLVGMTYYTTS